MQKEAERKEEFKQEKETLEKEVQELKERQLGREELYAKLKEDAKIRWHRDQYKKLLKRFDEYYNKLEQKIADKEQQIATNATRKGRVQNRRVEFKLVQRETVQGTTATPVANENK